jgi:hypothetical protein
MSAPLANLLLLTFARRGEEATIRHARAVLSERYPSARLIAIGTAVSAPVLCELGISDILIFGNGKSARQVIEEAQLFMPEVAAIIYDDPRFTAHLKLEALALAIGARTVFRFPPPIPDPRSPIPLSRFRLAFAVLAKGLQVLLRLCVGMAVTTLACSYLCWHGRSRGGRG